MNVSHVNQDLNTTNFVEGVHSLVRNYIRLSEFADDQLVMAFSKLSPNLQKQIVTALESLRNEELFEQAQISGRELLEQNEIQRSPAQNEPQVIRPNEILILSKRSRVEIDCKTFNLNPAQLKDLYIKNKESDIEIKYAAHNDHIQARGELQNVLPEATFLDIWDLSSKEREELLKNSAYKLILVLGGDDTLKLVSPDVEDQYIVLCNSNALQSNGVMANFNNHNIKNFIEQILLGNFVIEDWTRLEAKITLPNGQVIKTKPAINELSIRDTNGNLTGRAEVTDMGKIKGTGALVATGAGATGWFSSASKYRYPSGRSFSRTSKRAELCVREPYGTNIDLSKNFTAINGTEILTLISTSNNNLELNVDGQDQLTYPLPRASKVEIRLSDKPLKVINLRKESL